MQFQSHKDTTRQCERVDLLITCWNFWADAFKLHLLTEYGKAYSDWCMRLPAGRRVCETNQSRISSSYRSRGIARALLARKSIEDGPHVGYPRICLNRGCRYTQRLWDIFDLRLNAIGFASEYPKADNNILWIREAEFNTCCCLSSLGDWAISPADIIATYKFG
jgi:hypothetical protein